jgi:two-component sensor histidine kinase
MTGHFLLDGSLLTVSLFNSILMLWLGLTVLLNAGHRSPAGRSGSWGFWLAAGSLILGAAFFVLHSILLGFDFYAIIPPLEYWWRVGWIILIVLPFAWYAVMLWYAGFWEEGAGELFRRHRLWFLLCAASALAWIVLVLWSNPFPAVNRLTDYERIETLSAGLSAYDRNAGAGFPGAMLAYPLFIVLCMGLAFDALRRPGPTARLMGTAARLRARPWLSAASLALFAVCLLVGFAELWVLIFSGIRSMDDFLTVLGILDLVISALIALAILLLGQAIVAYEVFTGRILPRRGLARYWRNAVVLAGGYSLAVGWSLAVGYKPVYVLLLATVIMTVFYAMLGRRSYTERDSFLEILRPFVTSPRLYERLTAETAAPWETNVAEPFRALCSEILGCDKAVLAATGPMAPLWGPPLSFPLSFSAAPPLPEPNTASPRSTAASLDPNRPDGLRWALTLWSRRGPIGVLLLGDKRDGSLYTQEDFEIAQAACERFLDTQTSAELTRRLIGIQRERLVGSRILDRKTRRVLHDEILPALHTTLLSLSSRSGDSESDRALYDLTGIHRRLSQILLEMPQAAPTVELTGGIVESLRRLLSDEMPGSFDEVRWKIDPQAQAAAQPLPSMYLEVLYYAAREAIRNAAKYGRGGDAAHTLHLTISLSGIDSLELAVEDDGSGIQTLAPAEDATGQGLALHSTMMAVIGGELVVENRTGGGTIVRLILSVPRPPTAQTG